jgi:hypothetical protein
MWFFSSGDFAFGAEFNIASGDVAGLIAAINVANANGEPDTINLAPGLYSLTSIDNGAGSDPNGLPVITSVITINGSDAETTIIERATTAPRFRIFLIATSGDLTVNKTTVRGGGGFSGEGAGFSNAGYLTIKNSVLARNFAGHAGAILNRGTLRLERTILRENDASPGTGTIANYGSMTMVSSTVTRNFGGATAFYNPGGDVLILNSAFTENNTDGQDVVLNGGRMIVLGSTIARNFTGGLFGAGTLGNGGEAKVINSTITENTHIGPSRIGSGSVSV